MRRSSRRTFLALATASLATLGGGAAYRVGRYKTPVKREPDLTRIKLNLIASEAKRSDQARVLLIGNSATIRGRFFDRLQEEAGTGVHFARASANGARLVQSVRIAGLRTLVQQIPWDAVVLQDFSSMPLHPADRLGSRLAISHFARLASPAPIVLFPHWPSAAGHRVYRGTLGTGFAIPADPSDYAERAEAHYLRCARQINGTVAPVLPAWIAALRRGEALYARDKHHASPAGAALAAATLWPAIRASLG